MATHSSTLAWRIPGTGEPGGLPSMGVTESQKGLQQLSSSSSMFIITIQKHEGILLVYFKSLKMLFEVLRLNAKFLLLLICLRRSFKICHILWLYCHKMV